MPWMQKTIYRKVSLAMMGTREKFVNAGEYDAFTKWRKYLTWHKRELKRVKRRFWKRIRRKHKQELT
jgi:hypothetical protein